MNILKGLTLTIVLAIALSACQGQSRPQVGIDPDPVIATNQAQLVTNQAQIDQLSALGTQEAATTPTPFQPDPTASPTLPADSTSTIVPTATLIFTETPTVTPTAVLFQSGNGEWNIETFEGATDQMVQWGRDLKSLSPEVWRVFPNEPNPLVPEFRVVEGPDGPQTPDGLEYAEDETGYCEQEEKCDIVVPPLHYRIVTADYILPFDSCISSEEMGCGFIMIDVGDISTGLEDISIDFGFTVWGRYFNGDAMPMAIWSGLSKTANNMLHLESELNPNPLPNAGGNCSVPTGCPKARLAFFIMSGNELLMKGVTIVSR